MRMPDRKWWTSAADGLDDSAEFMSERDRRRRGKFAVQEVTVGAADAAGLDADEEIVRSRNRLLDFPDEQIADRFQSHGFHAHRSSNACRIVARPPLGDQSAVPSIGAATLSLEQCTKISSARYMLDNGALRPSQTPYLRRCIMEWKGRRQSGNVEDARGSGGFRGGMGGNPFGRGGGFRIPTGGGGRGGGLSIGTIIFLVVIYFGLKMLGIDLLQVMEGGSISPAGYEQTQNASAGNAGGRGNEGLCRHCACRDRRHLERHLPGERRNLSGAEAGALP